MAKKNRMAIHNRDGVKVLDLGEMEIWDGADLALLRETLTNMIEGERCRSVGVELRWVKYIPSGFFGMLYDWHEKGVTIHVYSPLPHVQKMLWFRQFFDAVDDEAHILLSEPKEPPIPAAHPQWSNQEAWAARLAQQSVAAGSGK